MSTLPPGLRGSGSARNEMNCGTLKSAISSRAKSVISFASSLGVGPQHHDRADLLAHHRVGNADHRDLEHGRVLHERVLDLDAVDVLAAAVDHVLLAVDDLDEAVVVDAGQVAGVQPAVDERLGGLLGLVPVAGDDVLAADQQLADVRRLVDVDEVELDDRRGEADGLGPLSAVLVGQERRDRRRLGQAEAVAQTRVRGTPCSSRSITSGARRRPAVRDPAHVRSRRSRLKFGWFIASQ